MVSSDRSSEGGRGVGFVAEIQRMEAACFPRKRKSRPRCMGFAALIHEVGTAVLNED